MTKQNLIDNKTGVGEGFQLDTDQTLMTNLLAFWPLREASGTRNDLMGVLPMTAAGAVTVATSGKTGNCADFDGANGTHLTHADSIVFPTGHSDFSISLWFELDASAASDILISKYTAANPDREWAVINGNDDITRWYVSHDGSNLTGATETGIGAISLSTWYHLVVWHDATADVIGIAMNDTTPVTAAHTTGVYDHTNAVRIGASMSNSTTINGRICDVGFWNKVLTAQEIKDLYNLGNGNTITR